jgi:hypothetical protein
LTDQVQPLPHAPGKGQELLFSSEMPRYQGARQGGTALQELLPNECVAFGPGSWKSLG